MKNCPNCSQNMPEEALRCEHCGEWHTESSINPNVQVTAKESNGVSTGNNHLRKPSIAVILSFFTLGLGHIYAGSAKKGIILFFILQALLFLVYPILLIICYFSSRIGIFILMIVFILGSITFLVYCFIDVIRISREGICAIE